MKPTKSLPQRFIHRRDPHELSGTNEPFKRQRNTQDTTSAYQGRNAYDNKINQTRKISIVSAVAGGTTTRYGTSAPFSTGCCGKEETAFSPSRAPQGIPSEEVRNIIFFSVFSELKILIRANIPASLCTAVGLLFYYQR